METMKLDCTLEERISTKSGKPYKAVFIKLTPTLEKMVMLDKAELEVLNMFYQQQPKEELPYNSFN